jgi:hypothetical protein
MTWRLYTVSPVGGKGLSGVFVSYGAIAIWVQCFQSIAIGNQYIYSPTNDHPIFMPERVVRVIKSMSIYRKYRRTYRNRDNLVLK